MKLSLILVLLIAGKEVFGLDVIETMLKKIGTYSSNCGISKTYYISRLLRLNWHEAFLSCRSLGLDLLSLNTLEEFKNFQSIYQKTQSDFDPNNFIGGTKIGSDKWYWVASGSVLNYEFNWQQNQPDNAGGNELCLELVKNTTKFEINDFACDSLIRFQKYICENRI
ncbi:unnamed protein product [Diamesa tonsa]